MDQHHRPTHGNQSAADFSLERDTIAAVQMHEIAVGQVDEQLPLEAKVKGFAGYLNAGLLERQDFHIHTFGQHKSAAHSGAGQSGQFKDSRRCAGWHM